MSIVKNFEYVGLTAKLTPPIGFPFDLTAKYAWAPDSDPAGAIAGEVTITISNATDWANALTTLKNAAIAKEENAGSGGHTVSGL